MKILRLSKKLLVLALCVMGFDGSMALPTARIDASKTYQRITGFGGFVCSPQFQYNHMSTTDIKKVWGPTSTVGCNIMRLYIPIGRNSWPQSLQTAKTAKQMGLIVFASPWGQPAEWKTNGTINAKDDDGTLGYLKRENWPDYAAYLDDYVKYMRENGVELDAISIQNEPDERASYAGCLWSPEDMAEFVKTYGQQISCRVMAPESVGASDYFVAPLNKDDVLPGFSIYGAHQYGGLGTAYKQLAQKGKELWMTEYLINWNSNQPQERNFDFSKDFFDFFHAINVCMTGGFNAWIHYAAKRFYGMLGDGQKGTTNGTVTKRGYVMAHFAKYVTGMTRVDIDLAATGMEGSAYLSETGDSVVAVMANATDEAISMKMDLPFYTLGGKQFCTTKARSMAATTLAMESETCLPVVTIPAQSVSTVLFVKSRDRQVSNMKGSIVRFDRLDDMKTTKTVFGSTYKMSGKTKKFDHSNPLISARTDAGNGYVELDDRYSRLVLEVKKVTSTLNYSSAKTTLVYVNAAGRVASHDYGELSLDRRENFSMVFDLSPATLADGCMGLISLTNNNWSSTLTLTLGDVVLDHGGNEPYAATLSGDYVEDDSYVLEYSVDANCTSLDMMAVSDMPLALPWLGGSNRVVFLPANTSYDASNVVTEGQCHDLVLSTDGGDFRPQRAFNASIATLTMAVEGCRMLMLPFAASVPQDVKAYALNDALELTPLTTIPAHTPVLVTGNGNMTFAGEGEVSFSKSPVANRLRGTYTTIPLYGSDYVLARQEGQWGFRRVETASTLHPFDVYATLSSQESFVPLPQDELGVASIMDDKMAKGRIYDLQGRAMSTTSLKPGLYLKNGRKIVVR